MHKSTVMPSVDAIAGLNTARLRYGYYSTGLTIVTFETQFTVTLSEEQGHRTEKRLGYNY